MCVLKCFKYKLKSIIIKILVLMAYLRHKYMFGNKKRKPTDCSDLRMTSSGVAHISFFVVCFSI